MLSSMAAVQCATLERGNSGPRLGVGSIAPEDAAVAAAVQCHGQHENSLSRHQAMPVAQHVENAHTNPQRKECGEIIPGSSSQAGGRGTLFSCRDAEGGTSSAMTGDKGCSLADNLNLPESRQEDAGRLRNEHDNNDRRIHSSSASFISPEGAASLGRGGSCEDASHPVGSRQQHDRRRTPTSVPAGPPPPPTNPPPHLLRRTQRRETATNLREPFSSGDVENYAARDGAGMINRKNKDSTGRAWQAQAARAGGSNRSVLPPPVDSPPRSLSHKGGVLKRRCSSPARLHRGSRRSLDFDHGHGRGSSGGSSGSSDSGGGGGGGGGGNGSRRGPIRSRTSDFTQDRDCSSRSSSKSSRSSRRTSRSTSGEGRRPHDVDDTRKHSKEWAREVEREGRAISMHKTKHGEKESYTSRVHDGHRRRRDSDGRMRRSSDKAIGEKGEHKSSAHPQNRHDKTRNRKTAEGARRTTNSPCNTARSGGSDADGYSDQTSGSSPTRGCRSEGSENRHDGSAKAQGSETTATPSPRDPSASGGSFGEIVIDSANNQRGMAWPEGLEGTTSASSWTGSRSNKAHGQSFGDGGSGSFDSSGQRPSTPSSPTNKARMRREGKHPPPDLVYDDDDDGGGGGGGGGENNAKFGVFSSRKNRNSGPVDLSSCRDPSRAKVPLVDNVEHRVCREAGNRPLGQTSGGSAGGVDTGRASRSSSYQGKQTRHDGRGGDRLDTRRRDQPRHETSTGQHGPERGHTSSSGEDERRCGGGGGGDGGDGGDHGPKKLPGKTHSSRGMTGSGTPRASAGGWFAVDGQAEEGNGKKEARDMDSSSNSGADNGRWRLKTDRKRASNDADGRKGGGDNSGGGGGGCGGDDRGYCGAFPPNEKQKQSLSLMLAYERGKTSDLVQCVIVRDRSGMNRLYPQYRFFFQGREHQLMMVAQKCSKNRSSNYHVFDMHRGGFRTRLSKKNGNYLGKVRTNLKRTEATIFTNDQEVAELGAISFEKPGLVDHLRDGSQPRKFSALLPALDCDGAPLAHKVDPYDDDSHMLSYINKGRHGSMFLLQTREPTFTKGNYRLNFRGRVTVPSVKNFQLVSPDDTLHTVCQFGKVGEDRFHLDYRAPINAFQAFCITLAQFNF